jgi:hypothetical protein
MKENGLSREGSPCVIELRLERLTLLFDPFDPFPVPFRDLSRSAEEFIVGWAREFPLSAPIHILFHGPSSELRPEHVEELRLALSNHFLQKARTLSGDVAEMFRRGRLSLLIGLLVLGGCLLGGRTLSLLPGAEPFSGIISEGALILGWVANWRPMEIFLYDWWPLLARRRLYLRLAGAQVKVSAFDGSPAVNTSHKLDASAV